MNTWHQGVQPCFLEGPLALLAEPRTNNTGTQTDAIHTHPYTHPAPLCTPCMPALGKHPHAAAGLYCTTTLLVRPPTCYHIPARFQRLTTSSSTTANHHHWQTAQPLVRALIHALRFRVAFLMPQYDNLSVLSCCCWGDASENGIVPTQTQQTLHLLQFTRSEFV